MDYNFTEIEKKWQQYWHDNKVYKVDIDHNKPKFYVLDMFPYPSGAGLHVGHPLGYIASDIYARYKRLKGFNVLHPMGYDAYGLPAEQYAIQTGTHPAVTTEKNINRYREQMDRFLLRLGPRGAHLRARLLQVDTMDIPSVVQVILLLWLPEGPAYQQVDCPLRGKRYRMP